MDGMGSFVLTFEREFHLQETLKFPQLQPAACDTLTTSGWINLGVKRHGVPIGPIGKGGSNMAATALPTWSLTVHPWKGTETQ